MGRATFSPRRLVLLLCVVALPLGSGVPAGATGEDACQPPVQLIARGADQLEPIANPACPGVRPGALVRIPHRDASCSFNFLFDAATESGGERSHAGRYIGTAGHCVLDGHGEASWQTGEGPEAQDGAGNRIGEFAYAVLGGVKDFALIRLDDGVEVDPQMCHWGGPTGLHDDLTGDPQVLRHVGQGAYVSDVASARTAAARSLPDPDQATAAGVANFGDSGSGVITDDGRAVGVIVTLGGFDGETFGTIGISRLPRQLARAEHVLGVELALVTAPRR